MKPKWVIGIDEVGRGPLAGPVAVCAVKMRVSTYRHLKRLKLFAEGRDSKKLSEKKRELYYGKIRELKQAGKLDYAISFSQPETIDKRGIVAAVKGAIGRAVGRLAADPAATLVLLDGGLRAPREFLDQRTIIHGDETELAISLASIAAKVRRDHRMVRLAKLFPEYDLADNKGYGSAKHIAELKRYGPCVLHRKSFIKNFLDAQGVQGT